ncbi:MAG: hypothetical protein J6B70_10855 [Oscillospiraceae bacterium]|nr:hypothetical protein [Oscillospiraceae bacterium]
MKFKSIITSHHDLKKNGYKILRKLHKLEKRDNLAGIYSHFCPEGYFVVLACKNLAEILAMQYSSCDRPYIQTFLVRTERFITHIDTIAHEHIRVNPALLSNYLSSYTEFFNRVAEDRIEFTVDKEILAKWNIGCIMAYTAVWGNR